MNIKNIKFFIPPCNKKSIAIFSYGFDSTHIYMKYYNKETKQEKNWYFPLSRLPIDENENIPKYVKEPWNGEPLINGWVEIKEEEGEKENESST